MNLNFPLFYPNTIPITYNAIHAANDSPEHNVAKYGNSLNESSSRKLITAKTNATTDKIMEAQSLGVLAVYEDQGFVLNGVAGFREFLERVDRPVGIVADFGNILQSGETIAPFIRAFSQRIVHVHLKDYLLQDWDGISRATRTPDGKQTVDTPLGTGCIDFADNIRLLERSGYRGCYAMEFTAPADGSMPAHKAIDQIQSWLNP